MLAQIHTSKLDRLKTCVEDSHKYFKENYDRYQEFMRFVFDSTLTQQDLASLQVLKKPAIEFNVLEAYCNRLIGEFSEKEPGIITKAADGIASGKLTPDFLKTIEVIEAHIRDILSDSNNDSLQYNTWRQIIGGGFSVVKVRTDYINEMSFEQKIIVEAVFDPCLCGFDPMARESHKGDGAYCFSVTPMLKEDFEEMFGAGAADGISFVKEQDGFEWSYELEEHQILLVVDFFVKEKAKKKIAKLSNGHSIVKSHYGQLEQIWRDMGFIEQMPQIIEERETTLETIHQYVFCGNKMLEHAETNFKYLPLVFMDGNSVFIKKEKSGPTKQLTKPYCMQAKGAQRLKNFAGQTAGGEIEDMIMHKFVATREGIPKDYEDAYFNVQNAALLVYNLFDPKNPGVQIPAPQVIQRVATPPIVMESFANMDNTIQMILGSYDAQMGIVGDNISGKAIEKGAMHSSASSQPYYMGYIKGLNQVAKIILDLIPKYYRTPRSIPIKHPNGKRDYQVINDATNEDSIFANYDPNDLEIRIEAGINTNMQKMESLNTIIKMSAASEVFGKFINTMGLPIIVENLDIRGSDKLRDMAEQFLAKEAEAAKAKEGEKDPMQLAAEAEIAKAQAEMAAVEQRREAAEGELQIKAGQLANEKQKTDVLFAKLMADIQDKEMKHAIEQERISSEDARKAVEIAIDVAKHHHETRDVEPSSHP